MYVVQEVSDSYTLISSVSDSSIRRTASQVAEAAKTSKGEEERTRLAMAATALSALVSSQDDVEDDKAASHSSKKRKRSAPSEDDSESDGESESKQQKRRVRFDAALVEHAMVCALELILLD